MVVGRILGAPVIVQPSTLAMLAILSFVFASRSGETTARSLSLGLALAVALFASVFLHEVAHAIAARAFRRTVSEIVITLWGGHTSFESHGLTPLVNGVTAVAGPVMNLVIAAAARVTLAVTPVDGLAAAIIEYVAWANVLLAVFNILPGIPMDGGRVLESAVWAGTGNRNRGTLVAAWGGRVVAVGVVVYSLGVPLLQGRRPGIIDAVGAMLIFSILWPAASSAIGYSRSMLRRDQVSARGLMVRAIAVPYTATVAQARELAERATVTEVVVLGADGVPAGRFSYALTDEVPESTRATTTLQTVTTPIPRGALMPVGADAAALLPALREWWGKTDVWVVTDDEAVVGIVRLVDVVAALK